MTDPLADALAEAGRPYGLTGADVATHMLLGQRRHGDAPAGVCGAVHPGNEARWCVQRADHPGDHNGYAPKDGCTAWADHCPRCAEHPPCGCRPKGGLTVSRPYLVQEMWTGDDMISRWTSEKPGVTGPADLEENAPFRYAAEGLKVYWVVPVVLRDR